MVKHERERLQRLERRAVWLEKRMLPRDREQMSFDWAEWSSLCWAIKVIKEYFRVVGYDEQEVWCCDEHGRKRDNTEVVEELKNG